MNPFDIFLPILIQPMTNSLVILTKVLFGNYGLAIIAFTVVIRLATWPLTRSQLRSSRAMSELSPKMQEIQKKYTDPKRRQEEMMKLYRDAGINPLGCLFPMLIQFPIWIALYTSIKATLGTTPESFLNVSQLLYPWSFIRDAFPLNAHFLWLNLGQPDPTFALAVLVAASTYVQQKMVSPAPSATTDASQTQMTNTMLWLMPIMFAWFTLTVPSGLGVYWVTSAVIGILTQYFYLGRKFQWRSLLTISSGPPAKKPAPHHAPAVQSQRSDEKSEEQAREDARAELIESKKRKRRRGRNRGKR